MLSESPQFAEIAANLKRWPFVSRTPAGIKDAGRCECFSYAVIERLLTLIDIDFRLTLAGEVNCVGQRLAIR